MPEQLTPRQHELNNKIADLLREYADIIGPVETYTEDTLSAEDMAEQPHAKHVALSEWVLCIGWVNMDTGDFFTTKTSQYAMPAHHQYGLLMNWAKELI